MNHCELQALRKMLMIDVSEAAQYIGKVSARTWQYWETAKYRIPEDVDLHIKNLAQQRRKLIEQLKNDCHEQHGSNNHYEIPYYRTFEEYHKINLNNDVIDWRIHQSAAATVFSELNISLKE